MYIYVYVLQFYETFTRKTLRAWNTAGWIYSPIDIIIFIIIIITVIIHYLCAEYLKFTCLKQTIFLGYKVLQLFSIYNLCY